MKPTIQQVRETVQAHKERAEATWTAGTHWYEVSPHHHVIYVSAGAQVVAQVWPLTGEDRTETEQRANLIAAAPELLAALQDTLRAIGCWQNAPKLPTDVAEGLAISYDKIERAIAKATGEATG